MKHFYDSKVYFVLKELAELVINFLLSSSALYV